MSIPDWIPCVECGGKAHLLTGFPPDEPPMPGDIVPYRCADCLERFDVVVDDSDLEDPTPFDGQ